MGAPGAVAGSVLLLVQLSVRVELDLMGETPATWGWWWGQDGEKETEVAHLRASPQGGRKKRRCFQVRRPERSPPSQSAWARGQRAPHLFTSLTPGFENSSLLSCN